MSFLKCVKGQLNFHSFNFMKSFFFVEVFEKKQHAVMFFSPVKSYALQHYMHEYVHFQEMGLQFYHHYQRKKVLERPTFLFSLKPVVAVAATLHLYDTVGSISSTMWCKAQMRMLTQKPLGQFHQPCGAKPKCDDAKILLLKVFIS